MVRYNLQFAKFVSQFLLRKTSNNLDPCLSLRPLSMASGACPARNYTDVQGEGHLVTYRKPKLILRWVSLTTFFFSRNVTCIIALSFRPVTYMLKLFETWVRWSTLFISICMCCGTSYIGIRFWRHWNIHLSLSFSL